ncbi:MAG: glycosyl transferase, group 1 [Candidatus Magasanikbacteria bacterium]|nr:glycosyl transferase, group 1 [Candidatus Magasanikbacteria bacterium]
MSYKRFDIVINAFNRLGLPLKIFGIGPALDSLRDQARPNIEFVGRVTDEERSRLYQGAAAFINPQLEDFGITAIESMSAGRPVIAYAAGGALETVQENVTGSFFKEQTWENLLDAVLHFTPEKFDPAVIAAHAEKFSV